jgi:hypothetical protein
METQMATSQTVQHNSDEVDLMEMLSSTSAHQTDDTWEDDVDDEDEHDDDGDLFDASPGKTRIPMVGWANDALRALKPSTYVGGSVVPAVKQWALAAKSAVMQCWGDWTGHEKAIAETREVLAKSGCVCVKKPVELSSHEKRLLKASLVKHIANEKQNLVMDRD